MYKSYKFRLYPTLAQQELMSKHFGCIRVVYNKFLEYRQSEYAKGNKVGYIQTQAELTKLKKVKEFEWLNEVGSQSLQMALRNLDNAYIRFFKQIGKYPNYKKKHNSIQSFSIPQSTSLVIMDNGKLKVPKFLDGIKMVQHRPLNGEIKQCTISCKAGEYYASFMVDNKNELPNKVQPTNSVGLDMGLSHFVITSDGVKYENKKYLLKSQNKLAKSQRQLSKKTKGSNNRKKCIAKVQKIHTKIINQRNDYLHKISNEITNQYDVVSIESLNIKGMIKNRRLSRAISDVSWGELIRQIEYKCEWKGKYLIKIDKWFPSSQLCSNCGHNNGKKTLNIRDWTCTNCNTHHDRDINASKNINQYGLGTSLYACGVSISPLLKRQFTMKQEAPTSISGG